MDILLAKVLRDIENLNEETLKTLLNRMVISAWNTQSLTFLDAFRESMTYYIETHTD